jgi:hypothetical protein
MLLQAIEQLTYNQFMHVACARQVLLLLLLPLLLLLLPLLLLLLMSRLLLLLKS